MRLFIFIAAICAAPFAVYMLLSLTAALARVRRSGVSEAREFRRAGVNLKSFRNATVSRQDSGSLIPTRAGISLISTPDGLQVRETRTVAKDVF